ncbi:hypothetical protein GOP97_15090 [Vibrio cholerae]|uniref:hypothetical protein n=1 Tax=Vibrio cholerae TaxID=666 RepID=UPI002DB72738|nr:hypothetical protein [Vibrio cholerae]MEB5557091.1 hypothetical protein [Vibrio cholerae]
MTKVIKTQAELYQVRHKTFGGWGDIFLICGQESVRVAINSDYGTFAHNWTHCGGDPKEFLTDIDFDYCMKKLTNYKHYVPAPEQYPIEVKQSIIESRREENLTKEEAREAWEDMLNTEHSEGDLYFKELIDHPLFEKVFGATEYLPSAQKVDPCCQDFWDKVWFPFIGQLKEELTQRRGVSHA